MTEINKKTKIARILKKEPRALEVLVSVTPKFERLRNPVMRKLLAGRTSLGQAARIGGCEVEDIATALEPLGFVYKDAGIPEEKTGSVAVPLFMESLKEEDCEVLDVRQDLEGGKDPLKKIMAVVRDLPEDKVLKIINSFEPTPLISVMEKKGYEHYIQEVSSDEVHAFFKLKADEEKGDLASEVPDTVSEDVFYNKLHEFGEKVETVDVRRMMMPMPLMTILERLSEMQEGYVLSVQHKRIPVFLFNELRQRNFDYLIYQADDNDVKLVIYHKKS